MIHSMTAFGSARLENEHGSLSLEIRGVNNRFLDLNLRIPEDLRWVEPRLRELLAQHLVRGKLEMRLTYGATERETLRPIDGQAVQVLAEQLQWARQYIPDLPAPTLAELPRIGAARNSLDLEVWLPLCEQACLEALAEFNEARQREGARLASAMQVMAHQIEKIVALVENELPALVQLHQDRVAQRLQEALSSVSPEGFTAISGTELSARIAQEAGLFGLRIDVAEELTRLRSHLAELHDILAGTHTSASRGSGKRLDFLFQEMNREANTLGSKSTAVSITQSAIELKLLIEQMREQAQNIE